jgi:hypothetical protein
MATPDITPSSLIGLSNDAIALDTSSVDDFASVPDMPWLDAASCGDLSLDQLDLFFVDAGRTISAETAALCTHCPVRRPCLDHAYRNELTSGFFGGFSPTRRREMTHAQAIEELSGADPNGGRG